MTLAIEYQTNKASETEIAAHLRLCDPNFVPPLSGRVEISDYAKKIASNATRFESWSEGSLIGLVAAYCNDQERLIAYITSVSVLHKWTGKGIAANLIRHCVKHAQASGMKKISLEVARDNVPAIKLYEKNGFVLGRANGAFINMELQLKNGE
jgi:ribosomal protein S18 acetylase RimI-like enzyme